MLHLKFKTFYYAFILYLKDVISGIEKEGLK